MNKNENIWQIALHMLTYRSYSEQELRQKLYQKCYAYEQIDDVINRLLTYNYINDTKLANILFAKYSQASKYSLNTIIYKLIQRGLPNDIIKNITDNYNSEDEWQSALKIVKNRFKIPEKVDKEKIYRFLGTRGFSQNTINKVFQQIYPSEF